MYAAASGSDPFRLAVVDMQMPGMDGEAVGRVVRSDGRLSETRLVLLTSLGIRGEVKRLREIGFAGYAMKPVRTQELKGIITQALATAQTALTQSIATRHTVREALPDLSHRKARILLAEDNVTNQLVALGILKKLGLSADGVSNGREAVDALKTISYDLVLMDVQMPEMNGLEAARRIRSLPSGVLNRNVPIIAMTACAIQGDRDMYLAAGMNDYVTKPVTPQTLAMVLAKWLPAGGETQHQETDVTEQTAVNVCPKGERQGAETLSSPSMTIWDRQVFLARVMNDEELANHIIQEFLKDMPRQIEQLQQYVDAGDIVGVERQAHTIKGAAGNVGGEALKTLAFEIENAAKKHEPERIKEQMQSLKALFAELQQIMTDGCSTNPSS